MQPDAVTDSRSYTVTNSRPNAIAHTEPDDNRTYSRSYFVPDS